MTCPNSAQFNSYSYIELSPHKVIHTTVMGRSVTQVEPFFLEGSFFSRLRRIELRQMQENTFILQPKVLIDESSERARKMLIAESPRYDERYDAGKKTYPTQRASTQTTSFQNSREILIGLPALDLQRKFDKRLDRPVYPSLSSKRKPDSLTYSIFHNKIELKRGSQK